MLAMGKMLALELAPSRVRVNVICPVHIETEIEDNTDRRHLDRIRPAVEFPRGQIPLAVAEGRRRKWPSWSCSSCRAAPDTLPARRSGSTAASRSCSARGRPAGLGRRRTPCYRAARHAPPQRRHLRIAGRPLLEGASLHVPAGGRYGLVGRNGTGKTTLLRLILGELSPTRARCGCAPARGSAWCPGSARRRDAPARGRAGRRPGAHGAARRGRARDRPAPHRRDPPAAGRHRRADAAAARAARILKGLGFDDEAQAPAAVQLLRRLADARGAGRRPVPRARPPAARRADQPSRPRGHDVARGASAPLSAHAAPGQPRPRPAQLGAGEDRPSRGPQAHPLLAAATTSSSAPGARSWSWPRRRASGRRRSGRTSRPSSTASATRRARPARRRAGSRCSSACSRSPRR